MLRTTLTILLGAAIAATIVVLLIGLVSMSRGGEFSARHGNKLMRLRIIFQGLVVVLIGALILTG